MKLLLLSAPAAFLLSSATPPPPALHLASLHPETVIDAYPLCPGTTDCTQLATPAEKEPLRRLDTKPRLLAVDPQSAMLATSAPKPLSTHRKETEATPVSSARSNAGLKVLVSIPQQKIYVFDDGELVGTSAVSTGKRGHETPVGTFRILQKKVHHRSNRYANAPMPYMQRLTNYGIALHAGSLPGYPASHGCIRLPRHFAKKLYDLTKMGTRVTITRQRPKS